MLCDVQGSDKVSRENLSRPAAIIRQLHDQKQGPPQVAKKWSGHLTDSIFNWYSIFDADDMREAQKQTEQYREEKAKSKVVGMK